MLSLSILFYHHKQPVTGARSNNNKTCSIFNVDKFQAIFNIMHTYKKKYEQDMFYYRVDCD